MNHNNKPYILKYFFSLFFLAIALNSANCQLGNFRMMSYNILQYGNTDGFCNTNCKDEQLIYLVNQIEPDIIAFNEVANNNVYAERIISKVLNINGENNWKKSEMITGTSSSILNMLYYNNNKFELSGQFTLQGNYPRINIYRLYFLSEELAIGDTIFLHLAVCHLKAGNSSSDQAQRADETSKLMNFLDTFYPNLENLFLLGDLNLKNSNEDAYQNLITHTNINLALKDPINKEGNWNANTTYKDIHTQSTRVNNESDGGSTGGSDDRFDFILCNDAVLNETYKIHYTEGTYETIGQDGTFYNQSITTALNTPSELKTALYKLSDHMPVVADFTVSATPLSLTDRSNASIEIKLIENPISSNQIRLKSSTLSNPEYEYIIYNMYGQVVQSGSINIHYTSKINIENQPAGNYILKLKNQNNSFKTIRFIK